MTAGESCILDRRGHGCLCSAPLVSSDTGGCHTGPRVPRMGRHQEDHKKMVGSGDRSEKIRTYNFPQSRVTDHRIGFTSHRLNDVLDGRLDELIDPLVSHFQAEKLKEELAKA